MTSHRRSAPPLTGPRREGRYPFHLDPLQSIDPLETRHSAKQAQRRIPESENAQIYLRVSTLFAQQTKDV